MNEDDHAQNLSQALNMGGTEGLTSIDAAALILSGGSTTDPEKAQILASENTFEMDSLQKAHLRRMMGFDFKVKVRADQKKILISSNEGPECRTTARALPGEIDAYGNIISEDLIDRLVDACLRLKTKWDKEVAKNEAEN